MHVFHCFRFDEPTWKLSLTCLVPIDPSPALVSSALNVVLLVLKSVLVPGRNFLPPLLILKHVHDTDEDEANHADDTHDHGHDQRECVGWPVLALVELSSYDASQVSVAVQAEDEGSGAFPWRVTSKPYGNKRTTDEDTRQAHMCKSIPESRVGRSSHDGTSDNAKYHAKDGMQRSLVEMIR